MRNPPFPELLKRTWPNWRWFKREKRRQLKGALAELDEFNVGCYFIPAAAYKHYCRARDELFEVRRILSAKEWGR